MRAIQEGNSFTLNANSERILSPTHKQVLNKFKELVKNREEVDYNEGLKEVIKQMVESKQCNADAVKTMEKEKIPVPRNWVAPSP